MWKNTIVHVPNLFLLILDRQPLMCACIVFNNVLNGQCKFAVFLFEIKVTVAVSFIDRFSCYGVLAFFLLVVDSPPDQVVKLRTSTPLFK